MKAVTSKTTDKINQKAAIRNKTQEVLGNNKNIINKFLNEKKIINKQLLQWMAFLFMTIDHIGLMIFPNAQELREIGRLAFPIFCFLLTEGFVHTHDRSKYYLRLAGAALISEIPYNIANTNMVFTPLKQNVMFELLFGFMALTIAEFFKKKLSKKEDGWLRNLLIWTFTVIIGSFAEISNCDYGLYGILLIMLFYMFRNEDEKERFLIYLIGMVILSIVLYPLDMQIFSVLSLIPIYFYNSKEIKKIKKTGIKYLNYLYYPVHFIVLYFILIFKNYIIAKFA